MATETQKPLIIVFSWYGANESSFVSKAKNTRFANKLNPEHHIGNWFDYARTNHHNNELSVSKISS